MRDFLYQYCVGYLSNEVADDLSVVENCSRIYLIDGQPVPFEGTLLSLYGREKFALPEVFERTNTTGQDSIHFQQLRAFSLAKRILELKSSLTKTGELRVAIVGASFAGLTAALTLLKQDDASVKVTLFEHHRKLLPRFAGAYGRHVHPYHHLRAPIDPTRAGTDRTHWDCPVTGGDSLEEGGIPGILSWTPGDIESVIKEVTKQAEAELETFKQSKRVDTRYETKVRGITPTRDDLTTLQWVDYVDIHGQEDATNDVDSVHDEYNQSEAFHAVIIAPGGGRDAVSLRGQSNAEYWNPLRMLNAAPLADRYEVAIIGSGNTAASEVFNHLLPDHNFVSLLARLQSWQDDPALGSSMRSLLLQSYDVPLSYAEFGQILTEMAWTEIRTAFAERLVAKRLVSSTRMVGITLFVRNTTKLFVEMNPVNRFLTMLFNRLGLLTVRDLYEEFDQKRTLSAAKMYSIRVVKGGFELRVPKNKRVSPPTGTVWSHICNCTGVSRSYQEVFRQAHGEYGNPFKILGDAGGAYPTLLSLLDKKQGLIKQLKKPEAPTANAVETEQVK